MLGFQLPAETLAIPQCKHEYNRLVKKMRAISNKEAKTGMHRL